MAVPVLKPREVVAILMALKNHKRWQEPIPLKLAYSFLTPLFLPVPKSEGSQLMKTKFTYWKEADGTYLGYLNSHPDHWTQGDNLDDLKEHLRDLYELFSAEDIAGIRKVEELEVA